MPATVESVLSLAMTLSEQDRAIVAEQLHDSISLAEEPLSDEMKATLDRRWEEIESGKVKCIPHDQVMANMRAKYGL